MLYVLWGARDGRRNSENECIARPGVLEDFLVWPPQIFHRYSTNFLYDPLCFGFRRSTGHLKLWFHSPRIHDLRWTFLQQQKFSSRRNLEVLKNNAPFDIRTVSYHEGQKVNLIPLIIKVDVIVLATIKKANSKRESTERHALQSV
jgi:hypothetical protein